MSKFSLSVASLVVVLAIAGAYFYPKAEIQQTPPVGTTSGTGSIQHTATFSFNPTTGATTTSVLNGDAQDHIVAGITTVNCSNVGTSKTALTGAGLAALIFQMSTTSASGGSVAGNSNFVFNATIPTSTVDIQVASSSASVVVTATGNAIRWATGTYLTISSNATNTATCVIGVPYLQGMGF